MNDSEQAAAYAAADWSESHGKIPGYFRDRFPRFTGGGVIDLGCGSADVTVRFAKGFPGITMVGVDGSEAMLDFGRSAVRQAGLESRVTLQKRYLPDPAIETRSFDGAISNSLLHHLADPGTLWRAAARAVKPGGAVLVIDLLRPEDSETALRLVQEHASGAPPILKRDFLASLQAAYTAAEVRQQLREAGLAGFQVEEVDVLHFIAWGTTREL